MKYRQLWFLSFLFLVFACNETKKNTPGEPSPRATTDETSNTDIIDTSQVPSILEGIWILTKLDKTTIKNKTAAKNQTLHINPAEGTIKGNGGCNKYSGSIHFLKQKQIKIDPVRSTKMACENLEVETNYFEALTGGTLTYIIKDKTLTLYNDGTTLIFEKAD